MTDQEMILLKSCIRATLVTIINEARSMESVYGEERRDFGDFSEDLRAVMYNVSAGVFGGNKIEEYGDYKNGEADLIRDLEALLNRVDDCDKSFDGYMLV